MKLEGTHVDWAEEFNGAITVCDREGIIVYMNRASIEQFKNDGGEKLLGTNLLDCHPAPARTKLTEMLQHPVDNMYTIEKRGVKKIIYQTPWKENGVFKGVIEISFKLTPEMPHFKRD
ncbi:MAG TPA: PAS domain-containing protein [Draconibacterium sp.]|nr:PAS domain-containing protein [Draconibacterium sp.]